MPRSKYSRTAIKAQRTSRKKRSYKYKALERKIPPASALKYYGNELKFKDSEIEFTAVSAAFSGGEMDPATANCLNGINTGDDPSQRDGRKYVIKGVNVVGRMHRPALLAQTLSQQALGPWVALVLDTQTNKAQLNSEEVYTGETVNNPLRNLLFSSRYKVLGYKHFDFDGAPGDWNGTTQGVAAQGQSFRFDLKNLEIPVTCVDNGATVASIMDNSLHIIAGVETQTATNFAQLEYNARVRFVG